MESPATYWFVRLFFQRGLALVYLIAFLVAVNQFRPLLGEHGLLPVPRFVGRVEFQQTPSLFFLWPRDTAFTLFAWIGVGLSVLALAGISERYGWWLSVPVWALLWAIYLSFVNVGQTFYAFGWESMLLEAGFLAIFLGPSRYAPSAILIWLLRWMEFRVMFGAGLIKLRGDPCWKTLTCLDDFYETQPMPNPLSWYFHHLPQWFHHGGVLFNHFTELIVPFAYFLPQPLAGIAAGITILFQLILMLGGNLSFLNLLTIVLAIPALDGRWLAVLAPVHVPELIAAGRGAAFVMIGLAVLVGLLSINPVLNLISSRQMMNTSFEPLHLVNTYGAFGSITKPRYEVIVEGTADAVPGVPGVQWLSYEFKGKPGDPTRIPPQIAPYHLRLDWLMWFAAMGRYTDYPWFVNFTAKLLQNDPAVLSLLRSNPFPERPPRYVRAMLYRYRFSTPEERRRTSGWWQREEEGPWFPAVSLDTPGFRQLLIDQGWM
jgi:hypothetical protein